MQNSLSIQRILVPVDFSETSLNALDTAIAIAHRHKASIVLLHVIDNTPFIVGTDGVIFPAYGTISELTESVMKSLDRLIASKFTDEQIAISSRTEVGYVASTVVRIATEENADLIVMGTHGASGLRELFIGSNAYSVIKLAHTPVLTVPSGRKWEHFRTILFPIRPVVGCLDKYDFVRKIIRKNNAELCILGLAHSEGEEVTVVTDAVDYLKSQLDEDEVRNTIAFHVGTNFASEILYKAKEINTDLIVITASLDRTVKNFFVGPFTQQIVNHARFPVLSIKPDVSKEQHNADLAWLFGSAEEPLPSKEQRPYISPTGF